MTAVPAVKGNMGNIEYFQCTMSSKDLVARTQSAKEYFSKEDWEEMGPTGKMQREVSDRYINFTILENDNKINIFFNKKNLNLIGWQTEDIYQNLSITFISSIEINKKINNKIFILPEHN